MRKLLAVAVVLMFLNSLSAGHCGSVKTIILVSNNPADAALASLIGNLTGWQVITTPWGVYNSSVLTELLSLAPAKVVIIGGPLAVPSAYETALGEFGINVTRWWGWTRYGTDVSVLRNASKLGILNLKSAIVVLGNDTSAILKAENMSIRLKVPLIYVNESPRTVEPLLQEAKNITVLVSSPMRPLMEKILSEMRGRLKIMSLNVTPKVVAVMIEEAHAKISTIQEIVRKVNLSELDRERIVHELNSLENSIKEAETLYNADEYVQAYRLLTIVNYQENKLIAELQERWWSEVQHEINARGDFTFTVIESGINALKKLGLANPEMVNLLEALKQAMKEGNDEKVQVLLQQLLQLLRESYDNLVVQGSPSFPLNPSR